MMARDSARWREIRAAFDEIVELTPAERTTRLTAIGAGDGGLRQAVESLLAADAHAEARLARFEFGVSDLLEDEPARPIDLLKLGDRTVSHFRIVEPIAAGGMGVVYRAHDLQLDHTVALKFPLLLRIPAGGQVSAASLRVEPVWDGLRDVARFARLIDDHAGAAR